MKILYFNNCWFTNVGEAFIDVGGMRLTKKIFGEECEIACLSAMTDYYVSNAIPRERRRFFEKKSENKTFKISEYINADYVILPGMVGTMDFLKAPSRKMVDSLVKKGCKVVFLGLGCEKYNEEERNALKDYFVEIKPALITTRDNETYDAFKEVAPCVRGIDCAFWSVDVFDPRRFADREYEVITFNRIDEPYELRNHKKNVVRPRHMQYSYRKEDYHDNILIGDAPYDYLTLYANAKCVYTDLVHATIVSLMYGTPVKYWKTDKRCQAFYVLDELKNENGWLNISECALKRQKQSVVENARKRIQGRC